MDEIMVTERKAEYYLLCERRWDRSELVRLLMRLMSPKRLRDYGDQDSVEACKEIYRLMKLKCDWCSHREVVDMLNWTLKHSKCMVDPKKKNGLRDLVYDDLFPDKNDFQQN